MPPPKTVKMGRSRRRRRGIAKIRVNYIALAVWWQEVEVEKRREGECARFACVYFVGTFLERVRLILEQWTQYRGTHTASVTMIWSNCATASQHNIFSVLFCKILHWHKHRLAPFVLDSFQLWAKSCVWVRLSCDIIFAIDYFVRMMCDCLFRMLHALLFFCQYLWLKSGYWCAFNPTALNHPASPNRTHIKSGLVGFSECICKYCCALSKYKRKIGITKSDRWMLLIYRLCVLRCVCALVLCTLDWWWQCSAAATANIFRNFRCWNGNCETFGDANKRFRWQSSKVCAFAPSIYPVLTHSCWLRVWVRFSWHWLKVWYASA